MAEPEIDLKSALLTFGSGLASLSAAVRELEIAVRELQREVLRSSGLPPVPPLQETGIRVFKP